MSKLNSKQNFSSPARVGEGEGTLGVGDAKSQGRALKSLINSPTEQAGPSITCFG